MAHVSDDDNNVIYANFGAKKRVTRPEEIPVIDNAIYGPAGARIWQSASQNTDPGRMKRGRDYAEAGHVLELQIRNGSAAASVAGSQNEPFAVNIALPYRSTDDLAAVTSRLLESPNGLSKARRGQLDDAVLDILIAEDTDDIYFSCTCPDRSEVCKHSVAVAARLASRMEVDHEIVFQLRGLTLDELERTALVSAVTTANNPEAPGSELFFRGKELPDVPQPRVWAAIDDSDLDLLHKAMRGISYTNVDQLRAVADIEDLYAYLMEPE